MIDINNPYSNCESCNSHCCRGNRLNRTPYFKKDKELSRINPIYIQKDNCNSDTKFVCNNVVNENRCSAYNVRPLICRLFPIYPTYDGSRLCIGISLLCDVGLSYAARLSNPEYREDTIEELRERMEEIKNYMSQDELDNLCNKTKDYRYRLLVNINNSNIKEGL